MLILKTGLAWKTTCGWGDLLYNDCDNDDDDDDDDYYYYYYYYHYFSKCLPFVEAPKKYWSSSSLPLSLSFAFRRSSDEIPIVLFTTPFP